ncbi:MAG TPA: class I SAM-dependent methyltransferase [Thermoanaerobaculia bacterium]
MAALIPSAAFHVARQFRSAGLWLLGPADSVWRRAAGREPLPPLWLRRHTGPVHLFESAAREMADRIDALRLIGAGDLVLDLGCGPGSMAGYFAARIGPGGRCVGIDIHAPSIQWCRKRYRVDPRFRFEHVSAFGTLPIADGEASFILAKSLFTHLLEPDARRMLAEIRRVISPGRNALLTAFLFERGEGERAAASYFPFTAGSGAVRWKRKVSPQSAIVVERLRFLRWIADAGLSVDRFVPGFWPGQREPQGQDLLVVSDGTAPRPTLPCPRSRLAPKTP